MSRDFRSPQPRKPRCFDVSRQKIDIQSLTLEKARCKSGCMTCNWCLTAKNVHTSPNNQVHQLHPHLHPVYVQKTQTTSPNNQVNLYYARTQERGICL